MASRVVPGRSNATSRSSPSQVLISVDFPTLTPGDGQLDDALVDRPLVLVVLGQVQGRQRQLDQAANALAVRGRHRVHLAQPELVELGELHAFAHALGLVGRQHRRLAQLAQVVADVVVLRGEPAARIDDEHHHVGFGDGLAGLLGHLHVDAALGRRLEAAGVDDDELVLAVLRVAVVAVAREPGEVGDDGVARLRQPVEERRLADVGAAHQGQHGFHRRLGKVIAARSRKCRRCG